MGFPAQPDRQKELHDGAGVGGRLAFGVSAMQGWRDAMEDAHLTLPDFDLERGLALFGVFDGHGGAAVAAIAADRLPQALQSQKNFLAGKYPEALKDAFLVVDQYLESHAGRIDVRRRSGGDSPEMMGCTAVVALVNTKSGEILVANAGDSRCILVTGNKAVDLSRDHGPNLPDEKKRITKAGGWVNREGRVNGNLNLSRALGDFLYKKNKMLQPQEQIISGVPELKRRVLRPADRYLIIGCDGIWERFSSQDVANFLQRQLQQTASAKKTPPLSTHCGAMLDAMISPNPIKTQGLGCDNMSVVIVSLEGLTANVSAPVAEAEDAPDVGSVAEGDSIDRGVKRKRDGDADDILVNGRRHVKVVTLGVSRNRQLLKRWAFMRLARAL